MTRQMAITKAGKGERERRVFLELSDSLLGGWWGLAACSPLTRNRIAHKRDQTRNKQRNNSGIKGKKKQKTGEFAFFWVVTICQSCFVDLGLPGVPNAVIAAKTMCGRQGVRKLPPALPATSGAGSSPGIPASRWRRKPRMGVERPRGCST